MRTLLTVVLTVISMIYPVLWYYGRTHGWFAILAAGMMLLWVIRAVLQREKFQKISSFAVAAFFAVILLTDLPDSMYWYPVWVNILMLSVFGGSLFARQSLIERLARLQTPDLPPQAVAYTRKVTQIWCVFFILNGLVAALLVYWQRYDWWSVYTGIIAYLLMGILMGGEWLYRKLILKV